MEISELKQKLEDLRRERNRGSKEISLRKKNGEDIDSLVADLKEVRLRIKEIENLILENSNLKIDKKNSDQPIINHDLYLLKETEELVSIEEITTSHEIVNFRKFEEYKSDFLVLEAENAVHPQLSFSSINAWICTEKIDEIIVIKSVHRNKLVGLGIFFRHSFFGISVVESAPKNFCDFWDFLYCKNFCKASVAKAILRELNNVDCDLFLLKQVNEHSGIYHAVKEIDKYEISESHIYTKWIKGLGPEEILESLSSKLRYSIKHGLRNLVGHFGNKPTIETISTYDRYLELEPQFRSIYKNRWGSDVSDIVYERRRKILKKFLPQDTASIYVFKINNQVIAYKIGFFSESIFLENKSCVDKNFNDYSINDIFLVQLMSHLSESNIHAYNFMGGDYEYKKRWSTPQFKTRNYSFIIPVKLFGYIYLFFAKNKFLQRLYKNFRKKA